MIWIACFPEYQYICDMNIEAPSPIPGEVLFRFDSGAIYDDVLHTHLRLLMLSTWVITLESHFRYRTSRRYHIFFLHEMNV
jgi:hypothetical protein